MGAEFAQQFPKIAARLGMDGLEVADPYVERLLEGVGFLAARVQLKLDAEFPRFTQRLLEIVYPHYLAPTPSMLVAQFQPDAERRQSRRAASRCRAAARMRSLLGKGDDTACEFRTAHDVTLWPVEVRQRQVLLLRAGPAAERAAHRASGSRAALRLRLRATAGLNFDQIDARPPAPVPGRAPTTSPTSCTSSCSAPASACWCVPPKRPLPWHEFLPRQARPAGRLRRRRGAAAGDAARRSRATGCCRSTSRSRSASCSSSSAAWQRPLRRARRQRARDRAAVRARRRRARERGRRRRTSRCSARRPSTCSPSAPTASTSPTSAYEYHVVARPHAADGLRGLRGDERRRATASARDSEQDVPAVLRRVQHRATGAPAAYFTRAARAAPAARRRRSARGPRSSYVGSEVFLVAGRSAARRRSAATCASWRSQTLCTNRDLPLQHAGRPGQDRLHARRRGAGDAHPRASRARAGRIAPLRRRRTSAWRFDQPPVAQLPVAASTATEREGAAALRELLELYAHERRRACARRQIEGVRSVRVRPRGAPAAACPGRSPSAAAWRSTLDGRRAGVRGRQRVPARRGAGAVLRAPRLDQLLHRDRAAFRDARRDHAMGAAMGRDDRSL